MYSTYKNLYSTYKNLDVEYKFFLCYIPLKKKSCLIFCMLYTFQWYVKHLLYCAVLLMNRLVISDGVIRNHPVTMPFITLQSVVHFTYDTNHCTLEKPAPYKPDILRGLTYCKSSQWHRFLKRKNIPRLFLPKSHRQSTRLGQSL